jgi:lauroyl/myristoyl acyltransferase
VVAQEQSVTEALEELERPKAHLLRPTNQTLPVRIYGSKAFHRALPTPLALGLAALRGRLEWTALARRRAYALGLTETIRGLPRDSPEARRFARRRLVEDALQAELQWRPWLARKTAIEGLEHLTKARAGGSGVILATAHVGPFLGGIHALAARGIKVYVSGGQWGGEPAFDGRRGRWTLMQNRWVEDVGSRWVHRGGSYRLLRALLERGEICWMTVDAPGDVEVELAGRPARVRAGVASLALETGVQILPAATLRRGGGQVLTFKEPIDTARFEDPVELTRHLAVVLGEVLLREPEQVHVNVFHLWAKSR